VILGSIFYVISIKKIDLGFPFSLYAKQTSMPRKSKEDTTRKRGKDKQKGHFDKNGKFSSKHLRAAAALAEKRQNNKQVGTATN
jgi:hypothetical protein